MKSLISTLALVALAHAACPDYTDYSQQRHPPFSSGRYQLSSMRPAPSCRTFNSSVVENTINRVSRQISDPDLQRLFVNSFPNTLDTTVRWRGYANNDTSRGEELAFVITGDIDAMWLRDSANQLQSYKSLLTASNSPDSLASLYRGVINLQARYVMMNPYCNSFQPPAESGIAPSVNGAALTDTVTPRYSSLTVYECKYEIDSLAAFLELSTNYFEATNDASFFGKFNWPAAVQTILNLAAAQMVPTYQPNGAVTNLTYTFTRLNTRASETQENNGLGNPFSSTSGLVRSFFRPSDDATIFQGFIPGNMMLSTYMASASRIARAIGQQNLASQMNNLAGQLRSAISAQGIVSDPGFGNVYAYEVDGYGSRNIMDDANIPSLLAAPVFGYLNVNDPVYQNTRKMLLSTRNPYWMHGPVFSAIGGPHDGPGYGWPMAAIVRILTSQDDNEIVSTLQSLVSSTDGLGLIHESIFTFNASMWSRQWFAWANGLFGQMILDLDQRKPELLKRSYQGGY